MPIPGNRYASRRVFAVVYIGVPEGEHPISLLQ
jgi:hypothetical protein